MDHQLNRCRLRLVSDVEARTLADGTRLLRQTRRAEYMALSPEQQVILDRFDGEKTVQEILYQLLLEQRCHCIRAFYVLVLHALDDGFLADVDKDPPPDEPPAVVGRRWPFGWGFGPCLVLALMFLPVGAWVLVNAKPVMFRELSDWLQMIALTMLTLSLANLAAACILSGFGRQVYRPGITWRLGLPFFSVDARDAFMGGRLCQAAVALQALCFPFLLATIAYLTQSTPGIFAASFAAFVLASPFGDTPAHNLLHAIFRREYHLPRCANAFLNRKLLRYLFRPKGTPREAEDRYLILYSLYAFVWLGTVTLFVLGLIRRQQNVWVRDLFFAPDAATRIVTWVILVLLLLMLLIPLFYQVWLVASNAYMLMAPYWFTAETRVRRRHSGQAPSQEEIAAFLRETLLFQDLPPEGLGAVAEAMIFTNVGDKTAIIREGDMGDTLFVIYSGKVAVNKEQHTGRPRTVATLEAGDVFGEIALLDEVPRTATVQSVGPVALLSLQRSDFERLLVASLGTERVRTVIQISGFLSHHDMFFEWPDRALMRLACDFSFADYEEGDVIIRKGEPNSTFYIVYEGECKVRAAGDRSDKLAPSDFFGEISLLKGTPALAEVTAAAPTRCLELSRERFLRFITQDVLTGVAIESTMEQRLNRDRT